MTEESGETGILQSEKNVVQSQEVETGTMQPKTTNQNPEVPANAKKPKKKKKKSSAGKDTQQKETKSTAEEPPQLDTKELTPDEQLSRELDWCIEQLELGLRTQKSSSRQRDEAVRALKTLRSSKAPLVKKRQVMRSISGDYRKKMEEDKARQFKLIQSAMTSARVMAVPKCKPVFHRQAERNTDTADKSPVTHTTQEQQDTNEHTKTAEESQGDTKPFVFAKTHEEFCFNFIV